jgi:hypothetical protein
VFIDWRVIGGTSDIARFLESEYVSCFQELLTNQLKRPWSMEVQGAFANFRISSDASTIAEGGEVRISSLLMSVVELISSSEEDL